MRTKWRISRNTDSQPSRHAQGPRRFFACAILSIPVEWHTSDMRPTDPKEVTLLVVDDDTAARECLRDFFHGEGYSVHVAADGIEALRLLERCDPSLVITDLEMPRMDGRRLIAALRERGSPPPIVVLTARMAIDASREAQQLGVDGYINKPIDLEEMSACVRALV